MLSHHVRDFKDICKTRDSLFECFVLSNAEFVSLFACLSATQVCFYVDGVDVTAPPGSESAAEGRVVADPRGGAFGSEFIVEHALNSAGDRTRLLLDVEAAPRRLWLWFVADALKREVLGGEWPREKSSLEKMLDTEPSQIRQLLRALRVPDSKMSDHLGRPLPPGARNRLASGSQLADLVSGGSLDLAEADLFAPGEEIAFQDTNEPGGGGGGGAGGGGGGGGGGVDGWGLCFRYGRVVRWL